MKASLTAANDDRSLSEELTFDRVYAEHFPFVWRCLRGLGVSDAAVDDAAQDVFLIVHRQLGTFRGQSTLRTWLFAILRNVASNHRRSVGRRAAGREIIRQEASLGAPGPLEHAQTVEAAAFVQTFLATLDEKKRAVFVLGAPRRDEHAGGRGRAFDPAQHGLHAPPPGARGLSTRARRATRDAMNDLDASTMLARARAGLSPSAEQIADVRRSLAMAIASGAMPASARAGATGATVQRATRLLLASTLAVGVAGAGYVAGYRAGRRAPVVVAPAAPLVAPPASKAAPATSSSPSPLEKAPEPRRAAGLARPARPAATAPAALQIDVKDPPAAGLEAELRALRGVERALRDHQPGLALALLRRLDAEVPDGKLVEERDATAAIARCQLRDVPFGVDLARDFADRHPDSVYAERVAAGCRGDARKNNAEPERIERTTETKAIGGSK